MRLPYWQTGDGSITCYSPEYNELYHGYAGAWLEAETVYFRGTDLPDKVREKEQVSILDVGFGLGYNSLVAIYNCKVVNPNLNVTLVSLEIDREIIYFDKYPIKNSVLYTKLLKAFIQFKTRSFFLTPQDDWCLVFGDARETLQSIDLKFDSIFLDPFSHTKNQELWTLDFFRLLYEKLKDDGILATYSVATQVRSGLMKAGFFLSEGLSTPSKKSTTKADKFGKLTPLCEQHLVKLASSPNAIPYSDPYLSWSRDEIESHREQMMFEKFSTFVPQTSGKTL